MGFLLSTLFYISMFCMQHVLYYYFYIETFTHFQERFIESNLLLISNKEVYGVFENPVSDCYMKDFDNKLNIGDFIIGYYDIDNPNECYTPDAFHEKIVYRRIESVIFSAFFSILITIFIYITILFMRKAMICLTIKNAIEDFLKPHEEKIKKLLYNHHK